MLKLILDNLRTKGFKITTQRIKVIEILVDKADTHYTVEELYMEVNKIYPQIGLATVYRTVNLLNEIGLIAKLDFHDGVDRYELITNEHHHHHLICKICGKVIEVEGDFLDDIEEKISKKYEFEIEGHYLKFFGLCNECK